MELKIFEIANKDVGQIAWVCAYTNMHALALIENAAQTIYDWDENDDIQPLPEERWGEYTVFRGENSIKTFKEWMEDDPKPKVIAYPAW